MATLSTLLLLKMTSTMGAVPINTKTQTLFGHSIKNGHLVAREEINLFMHNCTTPPCTVTQMHCPAAGPQWYDAVIRIYIDDDEPMNFTLLELANIGNPENIDPAPLGPPNYTEYYLGDMGKTCSETCQSRNLQCSPHINTGYHLDKGAKMQQHLSSFNHSILGCKMDPTPWYAPDQPGFVCGNDPNGNTNECIGWNGVPAVDSCDASYPEQCRVCHCVKESTKLRSTPGTDDQGPWGQSLFGHTANNGGVYSTIRFPFARTLRATITSEVGGTFWFIIRGIENMPVVLGDLQLPATARLRLHRFEAPTQTLELVRLVKVPKGVAGALLTVRFDADGPNYTYLEACMRALVDGSKAPIFLSSGAEDYFLSAYYFNEGEFKTPNSGLTYFNGHGVLSAYKNHDRDPIIWNDGFELVFRNMENTTGCGDLYTCPNQYCTPGTSQKNNAAWLQRDSFPAVDALYKTLVWTYEWPNSDEQQSDNKIQLQKAAEFIISLGRAGVLSEASELTLLRNLIDTPSFAGIINSFAATADKTTRSLEKISRKLTLLSTK